MPVQCRHGHRTEGRKAGKQANGTQRSRCQNGQGARRICLLQYQDRGGMPEIRRQVVALARQGSGSRDTARGLQMSPTTGSAGVQKSPPLHAVNPAVVLPPRSRGGEVPSGRAAAIEELWRCVGAQETERGRGHALEPHTGTGLAYGVGTRKEAEFLKLPALLAPLGIEP